MSGNRLLRSTAVFSSMTFLSRVFGLVRDQVYAAVFGASPAMEAFVVAFRIPNFMRRLSAEGSFSMAFVPVLAEYKANGDRAAVKDLIDRVTGTLTAFLLVLTGVAVLAAPWVMRVFAPGFEPGSEQSRLATEMLRITFPYVLFISLASLAGGILNTYERFAIPALSPVLLNVAMIAAALGLAPQMPRWGFEPVVALAWGVFAAGILQLAFQLPSLARMGLLPRPRLPAGHPGVRKIMRLMVPTLFGSSVAQFNLLFNTMAASMLFSGSVAWLYYSDRLLEFPLGMFGVAIGTVILPHLSSRHAASDPDGFSKGLDWGFRLCLLIGLPACLGLILCAEPLIAIVVRLPQLFRIRLAHERTEPDGAIDGRTRLPAGQGTGARLLCAAGHAHAGQGGGGFGIGQCDVHGVADRGNALVHAGGAGGPGGQWRRCLGGLEAASRDPRIAGPCDRPGGLAQRAATGLVPAPRRRRTSASPAGGDSCAR